MSASSNPSPGHSDVTTQGIRIRVAAQWLPKHNYPVPGKTLYAYRVVIENIGTEWAQLESRRWQIIDADGDQEVVEGPGVVGMYPALEPGQSHQYESFCPLDTAWGSMEGYFVFKRRDGDTFQAEVGRFFLAENVAPIAALH
jgi:ApaG protein